MPEVFNVLNILMISEDYPPRVVGGIGTHAHDLAAGLTRLGHQVTVLADRPEPAPVRRREEGVQVVRMRLYEGPPGRETRFRTPAVTEVGCRLGRERRFDLVHLHAPSYLAAGLAFREQLGLPLLVSQHVVFRAVIRRTLEGKTESDLLHEQLIREAAEEEKAIRLADAVICVSEVVRSELEACYETLPPLRVIPNGVDVEHFTRVDPAKVAELRRRLVRSDQRLALFVGRANAVKGLPELLVAAALVRAEVPELQLVCLLSDLEPGGVEALRQQAALGGNLSFFGNVSRASIPHYFAAADFVVMPSRWEPFGLVALEAMSAAKPLITSDVEPLCRLVEEGVNGRIVPRVDRQRGVVDTRTLARVLGEMARLPDEILREMGRRGLERVKVGFSRERMVTKTQEAYRDLVAGRWGSRDRGGRAGLGAKSTGGVRPKVAVA